MKKRINFIDALFNNEGHYIDDISKYSYLASDYELHYFINGKLNDLNKELVKDFTVHEYASEQTTFGLIKYFRTIKRFISEDDFNFIMSVKYIPLLLFSLISRFNSFFLLVHFFPTSNFFLNKLSLKYFLLNSNGFMVLDESVKLHVENILGYSGVVNVIRSRYIDDINFACKNKNKNEKKVVTLLGAMNDFRDVSILFELLSENNYPNIEFRFFSKGISRYLNGLTIKNGIVVKDEYFTPEDYISYLRETDFVYLAYKPSYGIRFSGVAFDALSHSCSVICNNNLSFSFLKKYNASRVFSNKNELNEIFINLDSSEPNFSAFYYDYSRDKKEAVFLKYVRDFFKEH